MNLWLLGISCYIFAFGIALGLHIFHRWNDPNKRNFRISELTAVILFFYQGFQVFNLFTKPTDKTAEFLTSILFLLLSLEFFILFGGNILPNIIKKKKNFQYRAEYSYENFLSEMTEKTQNFSSKAILLRDLSRKGLHILQFLGVLLIYLISEEIYPYQLLQGLTSWEFRNYFYFLISALFWMIMMIGDITRIEDWRVLPKWAWKWFGTSLDLKREKFTINGATPILLANMVWIHPCIPIQVLLIAVWISCISDALAALVGKNFGRHPLQRLGKFPKKTWEGLIAGILSTILGAIGILFFLPANIPFFGLLLILIGTTTVFVFADLFCIYLNDNLVNSLAGGFIVWIVFLIFQ
ncbi:hypothetical protein [Candidatus Harpocratesius sp.]